MTHQDWRKRVGQKDAEQFSVKGKMKLSSSSSDVPKALAAAPLVASPLILPDISPGLERQKKVPKPMRFSSKAGAVKRTLNVEYVRHSQLDFI